jgi:hypothetical protein
MVSDRAKPGCHEVSWCAKEQSVHLFENPQA